jgi:hypothetical protein
MGTLFEEACREIQASGVTFSIPADLPALKRLEGLAAQVSGRGFPDASGALLSPTLRVGNVTLYRLTLGAEAFLRDEVLPWLEDESARWFDLATGFVFAHANHPQALALFAGKKAEFIRHLRAWERTLDVTAQQLGAAVDTFMAAEREAVRWAAEDSDEESEVGKAAGYGPMLEVLVREYGQTSHYWLWVAPMAEVDSLLGARMARAVQDIQARQPVKGEAPDPNRPDLRALREFRKAVSAFKARGAAA